MVSVTGVPRWMEVQFNVNFSSFFLPLFYRLVNKIKPGAVPIVNQPPFPKAVAPFKKMENIANFLKAIRALGMKEFEMFGTPDLYDEKNVAQVARSIHALGRLLQDIMPDAPFPKLGIKVVAKNVSRNSNRLS